MKTIKAVVVVGLNAGYFHKNQSEATPADFGRLYQQTADEVFEKSGIYVGSLISGASVLYKEDWGCPRGAKMQSASKRIATRRTRRVIQLSILTVGKRLSSGSSRS